MKLRPCRHGIENTLSFPLSLLCDWAQEPGSRQGRARTGLVLRQGSGCRPPELFQRSATYTPSFLLFNSTNDAKRMFAGRTLTLTHNCCTPDRVAQI